LQERLVAVDALSLFAERLVAVDALSLFAELLIVVVILGYLGLGMYEF